MSPATEPNGQPVEARPTATPWMTSSIAASAANLVNVPPVEAVTSIAYWAFVVPRGGSSLERTAVPLAVLTLPVAAIGAALVTGPNDFARVGRITNTTDMEVLHLERRQLAEMTFLRFEQV
jgi:hypothetical protein